MKTYKYLEDYLEEDVIGRIYRNNCNFAELLPDTLEYKELADNIRKQEKIFKGDKKFKEYLETRNFKDAIEAEEQFKLGFKTAVKIVMESYHS